MLSRSTTCLDAGSVCFDARMDLEDMLRVALSGGPLTSRSRRGSRFCLLEDLETLRKRHLPKGLETSWVSMIDVVWRPFDLLQDHGGWHEDPNEETSSLGTRSPWRRTSNMEDPEVHLRAPLSLEGHRAPSLQRTP